MEVMLLIIGIVVVLFLFRSAPQAQIIYVSVEVAAPQGGRGCLPVLIIGFILLLALFAAFAAVAFVRSASDLESEVPEIASGG